MMGAIVGAVLWALSSSAGVANAAATPPAAAPLPASASAGCGKIGRHSTGIFKWTTADGRNRTRTLLIQVPADYSPSKTYSLNFVFHGAGGNSAQSYSWGLQNVSGASDNGIFVFPEGIAYRNEGVGWDDTTNGYDLPFFDNMVKDVETDFCIDTARVFVAGFSWGGDFVIALVCNRGTTVRAAAANSSTDEYQDKTNYLTYQDLPCATTAHPSRALRTRPGGRSLIPGSVLRDDIETTATLEFVRRHVDRGRIEHRRDGLRVVRRLQKCSDRMLLQRQHRPCTAAQLGEGTPGRSSRRSNSDHLPPRTQQRKVQGRPRTGSGPSMRASCA